MDELAVRRAQKYLLQGLQAVSLGDFESARNCFKASAETHATADAITYWGWMEHHLGNTQLAIDLCKKAIEVDPDFGNPYNDIGSYLVSLGRQDEAIPWLEKAKVAKRYEPRQFPHINLGNIYLSKNMPAGALKEFEAAFQINPSDHSLAALVARLRGTIN